MRDEENFSNYIITKANNLPKKENLFWEKFVGLRGLLSEVRDASVLNNWNLCEVDNWLRYQIVQTFRNILGNDLNPHLFKIAFAKVSSDEDEDGVRKDLCTDYIYRQALPFLQAQAKKQNTDISTDMIYNTRNGVDRLIVDNVIVPLMSSKYEGMPYVKGKAIHFMMDPVQHFGEAKQAHNQRVEQARNNVHYPIISMLNYRIQQFGTLDPLLSRPFHVAPPLHAPLPSKQLLPGRRSVFSSLHDCFRVVSRCVSKLLGCFHFSRKPALESAIVELPLKQARSNESLLPFYKAKNNSDVSSLSEPLIVDSESAFPYDMSAGNEALYIPADSVGCSNIKRCKS